MAVIFEYVHGWPVCSSDFAPKAAGWRVMAERGRGRRERKENRGWSERLRGLEAYKTIIRQS